MDVSGERDLQRGYWKEHSTVLSVEAMMLDSQASKLDEEERPEILLSLPPIKGKSIVELGAGIGRFTGELAKRAGHVIACDFMENAIKKNEELHGHYQNVEFICADVTSSESLSIPENSMDLVFSNWLLMYLSDEEVKDLAQRMVRWVKRDGHIFFRESCFHQSGDHKRKNNPTHYRPPSFYLKVFQEAAVLEDDDSYFELQLISCKCVNAYVINKRNQNQICWLWQKVKSSGPLERDFQRFLDTSQYKMNGILRYEWIFGEGFVSTGGKETTTEFVKKLDLQPGQRVLDIGCGIGGGDFYMAEEFDVNVVGIDLSVNMISLALERAIGRKCAVQFEIADCTKKEYSPESFDVIYSRDTLLHIQDKALLFRKMSSWLKYGGKLLITDYCKLSGMASQNFQDYINQRGYDLHSVEEYGQMLRQSGFDDVIAEDRTAQFIDVLNKELEKFEKMKDSFLKEFSEEDYDAIVSGWKSKLKRCEDGG
ncbi:hypothetical protein GOP47_0015533 [Adiantum capillus-veneris]|uniref:phosphoethanolamine N-methyltransferase n=1 Tax=Adiantum capillus-veneris TaxID=13818 RepID=A0A9D4ZCQ5_ADICA|nr:hypothetical protein GOP47_0015533 [Adiantum capillus-veneris]